MKEQNGLQCVIAAEVRVVLEVLGALTNLLLQLSWRKASGSFHPAAPISTPDCSAMRIYPELCALL